MTFTVPGNPIRWERPRAHGRRHYTPKRVLDAEAKIHVYAWNAGVRLRTGPIRLEIAFYRKDAQPIDIDNMSKLVLDALTGVAYTDDRQVVVLLATKQIDPHYPRTEITVSPA